MTEPITMYVIDTETTGKKPEKCDVYQISAIKVLFNGISFEVLDTFDSYIYLGYPLPPDIVDFNRRHGTGVTDHVLENAPFAQFVINDFYDFIGDYPVVIGHNVEFDIKFINKLYKECLGVEFKPAGTFDTLSECRKLYAGIKHDLSLMFEMTDKKYSPENPKFHTALADCFATLDVMDMLLKEKATGFRRNEIIYGRRKGA